MRLMRIIAAACSIRFFDAALRASARTSTTWMKRMGARNALSPSTQGVTVTHAAPRVRVPKNTELVA